MVVCHELRMYGGEHSDGKHTRVAWSLAHAVTTCVCPAAKQMEQSVVPVV
jgi:hypothetical protein